jgi:3D (Asp-Asp-Asp) domain-containing protein
MVKNHTYGLLLLILFPFLKEITGSTTPAPAKPVPVSVVSFPAPPPVVEAAPAPEIIEVDASIYHPEAAQTDDSPFITADGSRINPRNPKKHRWLALSRNLLSRWGGEFDYGDSVKVSGISKELDGIYVVRDAMHRRIRNRVDILMGPKDKAMGFWQDVELTKM